MVRLFLEKLLTVQILYIEGEWKEAGHGDIPWEMEANNGE